jgi:hypothetical protein
VEKKARLRSYRSRENVVPLGRHMIASTEQETANQAEAHEHTHAEEKELVRWIDTLKNL